jgi:arabinofuranosyltransferase
MSLRLGTDTVDAPGASGEPAKRWRPDRRWVLAAVLVAIPIVVLALGAWSYRWIADDGFINLRIVKQIEAGHGPVFNAGERVEASTSPLWIGVLLAADLLTPFRLEWVAVLTGLGCTLVGLGLALAGSMRLQRGIATHALWIPAGALVFAAFPPVWRFATSGLENGLTYLWLGTCFYLLVTWSRSGRGLALWSAFVLGLGPLVRPELGLLTLAFLGIVIGAEWRDGWKRRVMLLGAAFALPVAYEIFRMGYYGTLVPNSAIAKEASRSYWSFGLTYLRQTAVDAYALWIVLVVLLVGAYVPLVMSLRRQARRRELLVLGAFAGGGLVLAAYIVRVGGDFMHARLLLPALFVLLAPVAVVPATKRFAAAALVVPWAIVVIAALRFPGEKDPVFGATDPNAVTVEQVVGPTFADRYRAPGAYVLEQRLPGAAAGRERATAFYGVGASGYAVGPDTYVLDLLGLGDAFTSHLKLDRRGIVAHEKPLPTPWIAARLLEPGSGAADADFPKPVDLIGSIDDPAGQSFAEREAIARRVLACARLQEFARTYRAPMTAGRFLDNLGAAFTNFGFRIPAEPRNAWRELCAGSSSR